MKPGILPGLIPLLLLPFAPMLAQLPAPNAAGVSAGHDIFSFHDIDAANRFWTALGGEPAQLGPLRMTKFPGVFFLMRQGDPKGGTQGSTIEYISFKVKNLADSLAKWEAAGITPLPGKTATEAFLMAPDDVKVRITEDRSLTTPIAADQVKMIVPDVAAAQAWYQKWFGAKLVRRGGETVGEIPGANILFAKATGPVTGTKGRAFDRIGLEVRDVEQKCKDLEAGDPWGTYVKISEGLAAVQ